MDHLFKDFRQKGINAFIDDNENLRGEELPPELYKAIEESCFLIVIFSKNFASSSWCLRELTKILERKRVTEPKHEVRIVFYDVKPDVVRKQTGSYAEAFIKHEISKTTEQVAKWKEALRKATDIIGCDLQDFANGYESKLIDHISKDIVDMTYKFRSMDIGEKLVGVDDQIVEMDLSRFTGPGKVHMLGICGISGIGKTTLAKAIYNKICMDFEGCCFFENVQRVAKTKSITEVQMQIINSILKTRVETITNVSDGSKLIRERMASKPILLVLDDVDDWEQLEALAGSPDWFCPGSFIIFTGKDKQLLRSHRVDEIYEMAALPGNKALELFSLYAFGKHLPTKDFIGVSNQVVKCLQGHPLALRVLGGCLYEEPMHVWQSEVDKLQTCPKEDIQQKLRPSFDQLDFNEKRIFLDIACSLIGENKDIVASVLGNGNSFAYADMEVLVNKSLITISRDDNSLQMHELIRSMARRIMHEELVVKKVWSRLWNLSEVGNELRKNKAIEDVEVLDLFLKESSQNIHINGDAFEDMKDLRILKICEVELGEVWYPFALKLMDSKVTYFGRLKSLSNKLRLLYWHGCPFEFPSYFYPENIVAIDLSYSHLKTLWTTPKCFGRLKVMKLSHCRNLTSTPDFTWITNLKELILEGCVNLVKVHRSFGMLKKLVVLNMRYCKRLKSFPCNIEMDSLEVLHLSCCSKLDKLPEFFGTIQTLREFSFDGTAITELPSFVFSQHNLQVLEFRRHEEKRSRWWTSITKPSWLHPQSPVMPSLAALCFLRKLNFSFCNILEVPDSIGGLSCLQSLYLDGNNFTSFPAGCLSRLSDLESLSLSDCKKLEVLPELPPNLVSLFAFDCTSLHELPGPCSYNNRLGIYLKDCPKLFRNVSIESQLCMSDLNSSITSHSCTRNQISSLLHFMEFPSNTCEIFGGQERHFSSCRLDIVYHGNIIPQWFTNTSTGNHIKVELPLNFCYNKVRGYGFCVVLTPKKSNGRKNFYPTPGYYVDNFDGTSLLPPCGLFYGFFRYPKSDIILFHFTNRQNWELMKAKNFVTFSLEDYGGHDFEVKEFGVRLVFDEDLQREETGLSITEDLPTPTQDEGYITIWKGGRYTYWSW
ncbi:hypothetical protein L6452_08065 [Arctium lappa]|uniref:Uncharacterized protein n=1 Tax=Arctium lappa TaxID=4217 RepID=A0ACB9DH97_ARCLA|nr:hypothetical protein L6452_08065 [Arctium lappa]